MPKQMTFQEDHMGLQEEIVQRSREIHTDRYSMAINEALSMYENADLEIHPEFQRIFRWGLQQQSRLIESVFLGIPIPPIFVAARKDGVWDVVDGVQRLSTLFRFMGALRKGDNGKIDPPEPLVAGDYLKSLNGVVWSDSELPAGEGDYTVLSDAQQRFFKRARLDFQIVEHTSDEQAKFDLFQRLNSGAHLSEQEARNCLAVMLDPTFFKWLQDLASMSAFQETVSISERQEEEAYGVELALRYLSIATAERSDLTGLADVGEFLTARMRGFIESEDFDRDFERNRFNDIFGWLNEALGESSFKRYDFTKSKHSGRFTVSAFESVTAGLALNYAQWRALDPGARPKLLNQRVQAVWGDSTFQSRTGAGKSADLRIPHMFEVGQRLFSLGE
ncbi:DUF262 domain-containing protein [Streptomyces sp. BR123]|uniref:DUF262 domain-containing protein n=1 Tax=Streptomyces sp. BR123 TaxID=2749828 RepID=UPI0015C4CEF8|nr:DUF262 domain-containing protein [Streptomyces sp. BR123]NXY95683.1 DUF262 domain-containing protein [Streptomyces sp. BR123]